MRPGRGIVATVACVGALFAVLAGAPAALAAPPANDDFANAATFSWNGVGSASRTGSNSQATAEPGEPAHGDSPGGRSVWYRWTPATSGRVTFDTCNANFDTQLAIYTGDSLSGLAKVAGNDDNVACGSRSGLTFVATPGTTYRIAVDGRVGASGFVGLTARASGAPENDNIVAARPVQAADGASVAATASGSNVGATAEAVEPAHAGLAASKSIWFWWRPDAGLYRIDSCGSDFSSRLGVYTRAGTEFRRVLQDQSGCGTGIRGTLLVVTPGQPHLIAVDSLRGETGHAELTIRPFPRLSVLPPPAPVLEGDSGQSDAVFTLALDRPAYESVEVEYEAPGVDGPFTLGDWEHTSGVVRFEPGETSKNVVVQVNGDIRDEPDDPDLELRVNEPRNALLATGAASATILDDDDPPPEGWVCGDLKCFVFGGGPVRTSRSTEPSELVRTVPITRRGKERTVMEIPPGELGPVGRGDHVEAAAELEVSVTCLEAMRQCVGKRYRFSPRVSGRLVLASDGRKGRRIGLSPTKRIECSQELPNRNHHCVLVFPPRERTVGRGCADCRVLLRLSAEHRNARPGNKLVIGADGNHGIEQDKGRLDALVRENSAPDPKRVVTHERSRRTLPVDRRSEAGKKLVVFSRRLDGVGDHEQFLVDAKALVRTRHLPYGTFIGAEVVLAESPSAVKSIPAGAVTEKNGFNCTRGRSAHDNPCVVRKVGFVRMTKTPKGPIYANLVLQTAARFGGRWRKSDRAGVLRRGGIEIDRYGPEGWVQVAVPP